MLKGNKKKNQNSKRRENGDIEGCKRIGVLSTTLTRSLEQKETTGIDDYNLTKTRKEFSNYYTVEHYTVHSSDSIMARIC